MDPYTDSNFTKFNIISFNTRGFDVSKQRFCLKLLKQNEGSESKSISILCNQENFVLRGNKHIIKRALPGFHPVIKPAVKDNLEGRPKNGMFIAFPDDIKGSVKEVSPNHWRVQAVLLKLSGENLLIINTYFPQDTRALEIINDELEEILTEIEEVLHKNSFNNVILLGDINTDFSRRSGFVKRVDGFIKDLNLCKSWEKYSVDFTHVFSKDDVSYTSTIDHFFWSQQLENSIEMAGVLHDIENTSDHLPIYTRLKCNNIITDSKIDRVFKPKPSWKNASDTERITFNCMLEQKLKCLDIQQCVDCTNVHCTNATHLKSADDFTLNLLQSVEQCAKKCLPIPKQGPLSTKKTAIANWNNEIQPYKDKAQFWHAIWISAGKPLNSELHKIMKKTRNIYHYQIRKCKQAADRLKKNSLLDACFNNNGDIFTELKKLRHTNDTQVTVIDGISEGIPDHFAKMYENLYNSADDHKDFEALFKRVDKLVNSKSKNDISKLTPEIIQKAVSLIKSDKNDPIFAFSSDCIKNSPKIMYEQLATLFKSYLVHGHISKCLLLSTIVPLVKDKLGDLHSSGNYRSIALGSLILKILDWVLILICEDKLTFDDLQFSYQANCSTNMCTWMAVETIDHFLRNGSDVFTSVMDMKKAFDNVKHSKLFNKVLEREIPSVYVRLLMVIYKNQNLVVDWNGGKSYTFGMRNGVKQGAILSALLYNIYVDEMFTRLRKNKIGCWIDGTYLGIFGYADDIFLISPTVDGLQSMISTCEEYGTEHGLTFSTDSDPRKSKTKCLAFLRKQRELQPLKLNDKPLPWVDTVVHLGNKISNLKKGMCLDIMQKRAIYISKNNELMQELYFAHPRTLVKVNNIYNSYFYGSTLWDLQSKEVDMILKSWNVSQRVMHRLDRKTHKYLIEPISETKHIMFHLHKRFINFINSIRSSKKLALRNLFSSLKNDCQSVTGRNLRYLLCKYNKGRVDELNNTVVQNHAYCAISENERWRIPLMKEIIDTRNGQIQVIGMSKDDLNEILNFAATS